MSAAMRKIEAAGYRFTGAYHSYDIEKMKLEAKKERALGNKACVIRDGGGGFSVYAKKSAENIKAAEILRLEGAVSRANSNIEHLLEEVKKARIKLGAARKLLGLYLAGETI